jgi:hypothetical protein
VLNHCWQERPELTSRAPGHTAACHVGATLD